LSPNDVTKVVLSYKGKSLKIENKTLKQKR
jgi:hypothetical protein